MTSNPDKLVFNKEFTRQTPIPEQGIDRAIELMRSGRLHRYNTTAGETAEAALLEQEYADYMGARYCAALSSCGSAIYVALESVGVKPGDKILCNAFTLAPVPGAIHNAGAKPVFVEITEDYFVDLEDLEQKAADSGARYFLISHMRGHISDMDKIVEICERYGICMIEDCAHTMGASWNGKKSGMFGKVACFSTQTYKHINSGEGGLLITNDDEIMARTIVYSGSYMLYERHIARPPLEVFERIKKITPNFSLRMSNLPAAILRPQLQDLDQLCRDWNERYRVIEDGLRDSPWIRVPHRPEKEYFVGSSFQFALQGIEKSQVNDFLDACAQRGVEIKWFGWDEPNGFTSSYESWQYFEDVGELPKTKAILDFTCDFRVPLTFSVDDCKVIAAIVQEITRELFGA